MNNINSKKQERIITNYFSTPYGELILGSYNNQLCLADWRYRKMRLAIDRRIQDLLQAEYSEGNSPVIDETKEQLLEYFQGERKVFELQLLLAGSDFQKSVWQALLQIPYGETSSYLELSRRLGNEKAIRAVATANGANAISIIVPCHRIIGSDGSLVGYAGGLQTKKRLLELEGGITNTQLNLFS